jgi:pentatricopeptide repeat protein
LRGRIHRRRLKSSGLKVKNRLPRQPKAKKKTPPWQPTGLSRQRNGGKHMTCLKKSEPTEAWEIEDEEKIGDIELARQIREICNSVADSAEAVSVLYYGPSTETKKREIDRYERAKKRAEKNIEQISDELLRDTAIYQVLNFCMKAGDVETAERLFHQIQTARIAALVKSEHPMFRDS